jgi:hypothetical protein
MRQMIITLCSLCLLWAGQAQAQAPTCVEAADQKRLAGAARTSFLTKCQRDSTAMCEAAAAEKKLHGAAKTNFTRKCVKDAVGEAG